MGRPLYIMQQNLGILISWTVSYKQVIIPLSTVKVNSDCCFSKKGTRQIQRYENRQKVHDTVPHLNYILQVQMSTGDSLEGKVCQWCTLQHAKVKLKSWKDWSQLDVIQTSKISKSPDNMQPENQTWLLIHWTYSFHLWTAFLHSNGVSVLHCAVANGHESVVRCLLEAKTRVNPKGTNTGRTPLFLACDIQRVDLVKLLVAHKARVNIRDDYGQYQNTQMHLATHSNHTHRSYGVWVSVTASPTWSEAIQEDMKAGKYSYNLL